MKLSLSILACFLFSLSQAQISITGNIKDSATGKSIPNASVFINQTKIGTISNENGDFIISNSILANFDLVVSCIGYNTYFKSISSGNGKKTLSIILQPRVKKLETVVLHHFEKNGWDQWGQIFTSYFIGRSDYAKNCKIKNKQAIKFWMDKKNNILSVEALEPIIIENKALGYTIRYDLQKFEYDITNRFIAFYGFPFFIEMNGTKEQSDKWNQNRKEAYTGSVMQFMRSIYNNKLKADGFIVQRISRTPNLEKQRVKIIFNEQIKPKRQGTNNWSFVDNDSISYYNNVMAQEDYIDIIDSSKLTADSISFQMGDSKRELYFQKYLQVISTRKNETKEFMEYTGFYKAKHITSFINLVSPNPISIYSNGLYYDTQNLYLDGFWSWSEKIGEMLPYEYEAEE